MTIEIEDLEAQAILNSLIAANDKLSSKNNELIDMVKANGMSFQERSRLIDLIAAKKIYTKNSPPDILDKPKQDGIQEN